MEGLTQPLPTACALAQRGDVQFDSEETLEVKGAKWEAISAPAMPIDIVDEKEERRRVIAAFDFPFNMMLAEPVSKTQRKQTPKARAACNKEWYKLLKHTYLGSQDCQGMVMGSAQLKDDGREGPCCQDV